MIISIQEVERITKRAKLKFSCEDKSILLKDLNRILEYNDKLCEVEFVDIGMDNPLKDFGPMREVTPVKKFTRVEALTDTPAKTDKISKTTKVIKKKGK